MNTQTDVLKLRAWDPSRHVMITDFSMKSPRIMQQEDGSLICHSYTTDAKEQLLPLMRCSGKKDKNGVEIWQGDKVKLIRDDGVEIILTCEFGSCNRTLRNFVGDHQECTITGFHFLLEGKGRYGLFPISKNYKGVTDFEIMEVVGHIYQS